MTIEIKNLLAGLISLQIKHIEQLQDQRLLVYVMK